MAVYKNIPVEPETYEKLGRIAAATGRKLGAQVKLWVDAEFEHLRACKLLEPAEPVDEEREKRVAAAVRAIAERYETETKKQDSADPRKMAQGCGDDDDEA